MVEKQCEFNSVPYMQRNSLTIQLQ